VEPDRLAIAGCGRPPLAGASISTLKRSSISAPHATQTSAAVFDRRSPPNVSSDPVEGAAVRTRDEVAALVGGEEFSLNPREPFDCGRGDEEDFPARVGWPVGASRRARSDHPGRHVAGVLVDLVAEEPADRHRLHARCGMEPVRNHNRREFLDEEAVPASRERDSSLVESTGVVAIMGSRRCRLNRRASSTVGRTPKWVPASGA